MALKTSYSRQFKKGTYPDQHWDESVRVNGHEPDSPSDAKLRQFKVDAKSRQGVAIGSQTEARPGLVGKNDFKRRR